MAASRIHLRVKPGARADAIVGFHGGALKIAVAAPPEKGKANDAAVALLARALGVPESSVSIVAGRTSQNKVALVDLPADELHARLSAILGSEPPG
jgi:uncharacterized protein (TIGR00251 family)